MGDGRVDNGWPGSAAAWIAAIGERGDFSREHVLDAPMMERVRGRGFRTALDVGCGEGRFCRKLRRLGIEAVGIDPTEVLIDEARRRDPQGDYRVGRAEALDLPDGAFDLVVSYLTLIDIPDAGKAIAEMARVLRPGGTLLVANLASFATASTDGGWSKDASGQPRFCIDRYLEERADWVEWSGIRIRNWHRPLSSYMGWFLREGLILRGFDEPAPRGGPPDTVERYLRVPWLVLMEWEKPLA